MSQANVELVQRWYQQAARGDFELAEGFSDDFVFVTTPDVPDAGTYEGDDARRWILTWVGAFGDLIMDAEEIVDAGDHVFVQLHQRGHLPDSQTDVEGRWWQVITFRDGLVARMQLLTERDAALSAAGLSQI